ncbi:MAG: DUF2293 domain-containing protein [Egibacteraceae bacterium]
MASKSSKQRSSIERRVVQAAEAALTDKHYVTPLDVLVGVGWLPAHLVDVWRQGRVDCIETVTQAGLGKISTAISVFRRWARQKGLKPSETAYVTRTRDRRPLRFSKSGDPRIEQAYRTHWVSPKLSEAKRERLAERASRPPDLVVVSALSAWTCTSCGGTGDLLIMEQPGPVCLACADMSHLVFLPAGDPALTRRAKKASGLSAVVVRFSRSRKRYERQGLLVEEPALEQAERSCLADEDARARRRSREEVHRAAADLDLRARMAQEIMLLFPGCPPERARAITRHTAARSSGRVGRTAAGRDLEPTALELAVAASVRHEDTDYDELLMSGLSRNEARARVAEAVVSTLEAWRTGARVTASVPGTRAGSSATTARGGPAR